ncbi:Uncharacterised protein [uncultured archaeon]|nr:Uncharacterised protein [uncultured archaeon]
MTDVQALREAMQAKLARKREIIDKLKESNSAIEKAKQELMALPQTGRPGRNSPERLEEQADRLEFQIATSAYTPAQEKALIRKLDVIRLELAAAKKEFETSGIGAEARKRLSDARNERRALVGELQTLRKEIDTIYKQLKDTDAQRAAERAERQTRRSAGEERRKAREEERKEMEPYMKEVDPFVSLEEIAEIKRKPGEGGDEEEPDAKEGKSEDSEPEA